MDEDFKVLLSEYNRAVNASSTHENFTDSPEIIPILLANGAFTPSRLERWPFVQISEEMGRDAVYRDKMIRAFETLATAEKVEVGQPVAFTLNEKKAVSFLLAIPRDIFSSYFNESIIKIPRIHLATLEYGLYNPPELRSRFLLLPIPLPFFPVKLKSKYPLLAEMFSNPSMIHVKEALSRLQKVTHDDFIEERCVLDCAARNFDSKELYNEIITPTWNTPIISGIVLDSMKHNKELELFCKEYLE